MKKKLTAMVLAAAMVVTSLFTGITPVKAGTINWEKKEVPVIKNIVEWENAPAMFTNSISLLDRTDESVKDYVSFTLSQDSWVIMKANSSMVSSSNDGHETRVDVYSDASGAHKVMELEDQYYTSKEDSRITYGFLNKGTYYVSLVTIRSNYESFEGNINLTVAAIPCKNVINAKVKLLELMQEPYSIRKEILEKHIIKTANTGRIMHMDTGVVLSWIRDVIQNV